MGLKYKNTYPLLSKKHLQLLVVQADDPSLLVSQEPRLCNLTFLAGDQFIHIFYFLVHLTECFFMNCQPAAGISCIQNNLGYIVLNLVKMQLLGISREKTHHCPQQLLAEL